VNIVLLDPAELHEGRASLDGDRSRHVREVLGASVGTKLRIGIVDGPLGHAEVVSIDGERVTISCTLDAEPPARPSIDLVLALPRPKVLARLFAPLAQLGVDRIVLTSAWKVEKFYFDAHVLRPEEHVPKLLEGLAQAKDTRVPIVTVHRSLTFLIEHELDALVPEAALRLHADPAATSPLEARINDARPSRLVLAIGPEGGFTAREVRMLEAHRFHGVGLGARVLRSDVATIALLARAHAALEASPR
jgi:RsmE family RNA methyltransferase